MTGQDRHVEPETSESDETGQNASPQRRHWLVWIGLAGIVFLSIVAGIGRALHLDVMPAGLAEAELQHGLLARQSADFGLQWAIENAGSLSVPLVIVITWAGGLGGFDAETPRIAAVLFGAGSILFTGLWLFRAMGPLWGMAGAAVLAGSFWHILYSRLATGQIVGAFALAALLWFLFEATSRRGQSAAPWYLLAGLAAGLGFLSTPSLRLLPLVIPGILIVSLWRLRTNEHPETSHARNWLIATAATWLTISPYLFSQRGDLRSLTPWTAPPGLPGADPLTPGTLPGALIDTATGLVIASDVERGMNLPADPWFSLFMLPWAIIGVLGLISASNDPGSRDTFLAGAGIAVAILAGILAYDAGHPGQLVVISPALAGVTVYGFRTIMQWATVRTARLALACLIVAGVVGQGALSIERYSSEWTEEPATSDAFHADVIDTLSRLTALETREPVFLSITDHETARDYFRSTARLHAFDGRHALLFSAEEDGYLIETGAALLASTLADMLEQSVSVTQEIDDTGLTAWRLDARIREELPLSVPTITYSGGRVFSGSSDLARTGDGTARVVLAWQSAPDSPAVPLELRLNPTDPSRQATVAETTIPANPLRGPAFQILLVEIEIPEGDPTSDLEMRLRREDGAIHPVAGMDEDGYLLLNRYVFPE